MIRIIVASSLVVSPLNISVSLNKFLCSSLLCSKVAISTATVHSIKLPIYFWHLNIDLEMSESESELQDTLSQTKP